MEEGESPIEKEEGEKTSELFEGLELIYGRGKSGYKDVYPHRKGCQAKITVEDKGMCSLGIFKEKRNAAVAVARAKARGLHLLNSPDKTRAKPGFGGAREPGASFAKSFHDCLLSCVAAGLMELHTVKRKVPSAPMALPTYSLASIENSPVQISFRCRCSRWDRPHACKRA